MCPALRHTWADGSYRETRTCSDPGVPWMDGGREAEPDKPVEKLWRDLQT